MSVSREERIRAEAYNRWEREGRPHGEDIRHWWEAAQAVEASVDEIETEIQIPDATEEPVKVAAAKARRTRAKKAAE